MKRARPVRYTLEDLDFLEATYEKSPFVSAEQSQKIADSMGFTQSQIQIWFKCRRNKDENVVPQLRFTPAQREQLEAAYQINQTPNKAEQAEIAKTLHIGDVKRVHNWFQSKKYTIKRTVSQYQYTKEQRALLVQAYLKNKYPKQKEREKLAEEVGVPEEQIRNWFGNRKSVKTRRGWSDTEEKAALAAYQENRSKFTHHVRAAISPTTTKILEDAFELNPQPTNEELQTLHEKTNFDMDRIIVWFDRKKRGIEQQAGYEKLKSEEQLLTTLKESYQKNKYRTSKELDELADQLGVKRIRVHDWFKNSRSTDKDYKHDFLLDRMQQKKTPEQIAALTEVYKTSKVLKTKVAAELADRLGMKVTQVQGWFEHKRYRDKDYKRKIITYSTNQNRILKDAFAKNPRPSREEKLSVAKAAGLTLSQVATWFPFERRRSGRALQNPNWLTAEQKGILLEAFEENPYPKRAKKEELANRIGVQWKRIEVWFIRIRQLRRRKGTVPLQKNEEESCPKLEDMDVEIKVECMDAELDDKNQSMLH